MSRQARVWFSVTAAVVVVALALRIPITAGAVGGSFSTPAARVANLFSFFTILTNLIVAGTCLLLAIEPDRRSTLVRALRLDAVVGIAVTGVVYHTLLAGMRELRGAEWLADQLFHTVTPILAVLGWLVVGPRGLIDRSVVAWAVLYPLAWLGFTLVRGAVIDWYPYPFVDVTELGYARVALNCAGIAALFLLLAAGAMVLDRRLDRSPRTAPAPR